MQHNSVTGLDSEAEHSKLQRGLSYRHIQLIAIGGAIGTGLFLGSAKTIALTGPSIVLVYAIIGSVIYFVLRAMGEILLSNPKYKSFTDFITDFSACAPASSSAGRTGSSGSSQVSRTSSRLPATCNTGYPTCPNSFRR